MDAKPCEQLASAPAAIFSPGWSDAAGALPAKGNLPPGLLRRATESEPTELLAAMQSSGGSSQDAVCAWLGTLQSFWMYLFPRHVCKIQTSTEGQTDGQNGIE